MRLMRYGTWSVFLGMLLSVNSAGAAEPFIAGTAPSVRPADAQTMAPQKKGSDWYKTARRGIAKPYPKSLNFLEDQGRWYTPFTRRGMPGIYDIRELHD